MRKGVPAFFSAPFGLIFSHRQLLKEFVLRDIRGRFAGSFAGMLWTIINPLATILAYYFVFSLVLRVSVTVDETGTDRFIFFFLSGFFPWIIFADTLSKSVGSLVAQAGLITKVVFPVELIPISTIFSVFVTGGIGYFIFLIYLGFSGYFHPCWFGLPLLLCIEFVFALGCAFFLSALCVFIRDTSEILAILLMLLFFATPVIYPASMIPNSLQWILLYNPMALFVQCFQDLLLKHSVDPWMVLKVSFVALMFYIPGTWFFMRSKPAFGDVL